MLSNQNVENPFLAQSWLKDGNRNKISTPLLVIPALQRIEPKGHSLISLVKTGQLAHLPKDRESLFLFKCAGDSPETR
ncbi:MAG: fimbria/pilus periplasmic chaperone [Candidatus Malihini olakiniferum]